MGYVVMEQVRLVVRGPQDDAPVVYVVGSSEHPFDFAEVLPELAATVVAVPVISWNDALTPWPAQALYRGEEPFGGHAVTTLDELVNEAIPAIEKGLGLAPRSRAVCGYSLGGLFALYALVQTEAFVACASISASMWYEGWTDYLDGLDVDLRGRFAYLSIGTKEKRAARPILKTSQSKMEECVRILEQKGCAVCYQTGPGNHMQHMGERFVAGLVYLDQALNSVMDATSALHQSV